jgi:hypothetical protein
LNREIIQAFIFLCHCSTPQAILWTIWFSKPLDKTRHTGRAVWNPYFEMETSAFILKENIFLLTTTHGGLDCCVTSIRLMEEKKPAVLQLQRCYYFLRRANGLMTIASGKPMERGSATFEEKMIIIFFSCMAGRSPLLSEMVMIPLPLSSFIPTPREIRFPLGKDARRRIFYYC